MHCNKILLLVSGVGRLMGWLVDCNGKYPCLMSLCAPSWQDKSTCMAAHSVLPLLLENHDVIITNPGTGLVVAHLVSLIHDQEGFIIAVGGASSSTQTTMQDNLDFLGASKGIQIFHLSCTSFTLGRKENPPASTMQSVYILISINNFSWDSLKGPLYILWYFASLKYIPKWNN